LLPLKTFAAKFVLCNCHKIITTCVTSSEILVVRVDNLIFITHSLSFRAEKIALVELYDIYFV